MLHSWVRKLKKRYVNLIKFSFLVLRKIIRSQFTYQNLTKDRFSYKNNGLWFIWIFFDLLFRMKALYFSYFQIKINKTNTFSHNGHSRNTLSLQRRKKLSSEVT